MDNLSQHTLSQPVATPATPAAQASAATEATPLDDLVHAMAEQGLFGKLRIGASLLLFGEATIPSHDKPASHHYDS